MDGIKEAVVREIATLLAALVLVGCTLGCGSSAPATNARNEADWSEAQEWARRQVEPYEGMIGAAKAREQERELAKARYDTLTAREGYAEGVRRGRGK